MQLTFRGRKLKFGDKPPRLITLFDQRERLVSEGIEASYRNANTVWKAAAAARIAYLAKRVSRFTSDDVIEFLDRRGITTGNNSALGAIFRSAQRMGMITNTGSFKESRRPQQHNAPVRVWRSNRFGHRTPNGRINAKQG